MLHTSSRNLIITFSTYFLLMFSTAIGQTTVDIPAVGTWIGILKAGGVNLRVVFRIDVTDTGTFTGTVSSPDKGVKGIPLSRVFVSNDSLVIAVSAANAGYAGKFSNNKATIEGIWKEGGIVFPMTLDRTNDTIDFKGAHNFSDNAVSLNLRKESQHFDLYSLEKDIKALDDISKELEDNFDRITNRLQTQFKEKIRVYIYPDVKTFHTAMYMPDAPDWAIGAAGINELKMVSPLNPGSAHTYSSLMQAIVHELVHATVLQARDERGLADLPKWLNEGYAFYEAHQMNDDMRKTVKSHSLENKTPTWTQLDTADMAEFGNMGGYPLSTMIIEFLVDTYGFDKLMKLIKEPENMNIIYGKTKEELEKQWVQYLKNL